MSNIEMRVQLDEGAYMPQRAHEADAGMDLRTPRACTVPVGGSAVIDTGVHVDLPVGTVGMLKSKSGLNVKAGLLGEGVIDSGYTGSIVVKLYNHGGKPHRFERGDKVTQLVVLPCIYVEPVEVESLNETERGDGGFGSTGR